MLFLIWNTHLALKKIYKHSAEWSSLPSQQHAKQQEEDNFTWSVFSVAKKIHFQRTKTEHISQHACYSWKGSQSAGNQIKDTKATQGTFVSSRKETPTPMQPWTHIDIDKTNDSMSTMKLNWHIFLGPSSASQKFLQWKKTVKTCLPHKITCRNRSQRD